MRVAYVISTLDTGGAERLLVNLINHLRDGIAPTVLVLREQVTIASQIENPRATLRVIGLRSAYGLKGWVRLARELRQARPDVIHSHMLLSNLACRFLKPVNRGITLVNHEHGLGDWRPLVIRLAERWSQSRVDRIIVASEASRRARVLGSGIAENRIRVIPNAIDWSFWSQRTRARDGARVPRWGVAARLIQLKRVNLALRLFAEARKGGFPGELWIAGDGPEKSHLEKIAAELSLGSFVRFLGQVADMRTFYSEIDALLLTSASEDCPMSVLEGMASGLFVAATSVGGAPELLANAPDCLVIDQDSDPAVPASILAGVPAGFDSMGNRAYCKRYDMATYVQEVLRVYAEANPQLPTKLQGDLSTSRAYCDDERGC